MSPPARSPDWRAAISRSARGPHEPSNVWTIWSTTSSLASPFPSATQSRPAALPAHPAQVCRSAPVYAATPPSLSTRANCLLRSLVSPLSSMSTACPGVAPHLRSFSPAIPCRGFPKPCVATTPTSASPYGTRLPTPGNLDAHATPRSPLVASQPRIEYVTDVLPSL